MNEIKTIYPQVTGCTYSESFVYHDTLSVPLQTTVVVLSVKSGIKKADRDKINNWLAQRLKSSRVRVFYE